MKIRAVSAASLHLLFNYDPVTGDLIWKRRPREWFDSERIYKSWNSKNAGCVAGCVQQDGYLQISMFGVNYLAHTLVWTMVFGEAPLATIDHKNGRRSDNRIANLRVAGPLLNGRNMAMHSNNTSGVNGVYWCKQVGRWKARIKIEGKYIYLGSFDDLSTAAAVRESADRFYGFDGRHGRPQCI